MAEEISELLRARLGVRGRDLPERLRKARRLLPRHQRRAIARLSAAARMEGHPKLARQIDRAGIEADWRAAKAYLEALSRGKRRADMAIGALASAAFALLASAVLLVVALRWRGLL